MTNLLNATERDRICFTEIATKIQDEPGIYVIWMQSGIPLKVGIARNLRRRLKTHAVSRDSGLKGLEANPMHPRDLTSKASILAKHLYFDRALTVASTYDLRTENGRKKFLAEKCYITFQVTKTRDEARELEKQLEKTGAFRYAHAVRTIETEER